MKGILFAGALLIWMPGLAFAQSFDAGDVGTILRLGKEIIESQQPRQVPPPQQAAPRRAPANTTTSPSTPAYGADNVRDVQQRLTDLGYSPGPVDGMMGGKTAAAIRRFEQDRGLAPIGRIDDDLLAALSNAGTGAPVSAQAAAQPSFDCARAGNATESTICAVPELAVLDRQLADAYRKARASGDNGIGQQQRQWIDQRNRCLNNAACIAQSMRSRLAALGSGAPAPSPGPTSSPVQLAEVLEGKEAYDYLLARYVRQHPDLTEDEAFVSRFAGWNCSERDFYRKSHLNPFELRAAMKNTTQRLKTLAASPAPVSAPMVAFELTLKVADYDFESGSFPIMTTVRAETTPVRSPDYCNTVAKAKGVYEYAGFPANFWAAGPTGQPLDTSAIRAMIGDLSMAQADAQEFYEKGFPTIVVKVVGQVTDVAGPGSDGSGVVTLHPREVTVRTQSYAKYARELARFGPADLRLLEAGDTAEPDEQQEEPQTAWLQPSTIQLAYLKEHPEVLNDPKVAADLAYWDGDRGCTEEANAADNQFEEHRLLSPAPGLARSRLQEFKEPETLHAITTGVLSKYDMASGGFNMRNLNRDPAHPGQASMQINQQDSTSIPNCVTNNWRIPVDATNVVFTDQGKTEFLPLDPAVAEPLVTSGITTVRIEIDAVNTGFAENGGYGDQPALTAQVTHIAFRNEKTNALLYETDVAAPAQTAWDTTREISVVNLLMHQLRQNPSLANTPGFHSFYMAAARCHEMNRAEDNPIRLARLKKELVQELTSKLAEPAPDSPLFLINFDSEKLGTYDIDRERFPFTPHGEYHSFFNKTYVEGVSSGCEPKDNNGLSTGYKLNLTGADGLIAAGMPMDIDSAETFIDGFTNGERRVRIEVLAEVSGFRTTPADNNHQAMPVNARVVAMRVIDPKDGSVIYETSDPNVLASADAVSQAANHVAPSKAEAEPAPDSKASATEGTEAPARQPDSAVPDATKQAALDVLGLEIRKPLAKTLPEIRQTFAPQEVLYGKRELWWNMDELRSRLEPTSPLLESVILARKDGRDVLTIFHEPLLPDDPITGIARSIAFPEGQRPALGAITETLRNKYGAPADREKHAFSWFRAPPIPEPSRDENQSLQEILTGETRAQMAKSAAYGCRKLLSAAAFEVDYKAQTAVKQGYPSFAETLPVFDESGKPATSPATNPFWSLGIVDSSNPKCTEDIVLAVIEPDKSGLVAALHILMTNRGYVAETTANAGKARIDKNSKNAGKTPNIKL